MPQQNETMVLCVSHKHGISNELPEAKRCVRIQRGEARLCVAVFWFQYLHPENVKQSSRALSPCHCWWSVLGVFLLTPDSGQTDRSLLVLLCLCC